MKITFNLKEPNKAESLILLFCRWNGNLVKLSTRHRIECRTWNKNKQECSISKSKYSDESNYISEKTNKFLAELLDAIQGYVLSDNFNEGMTASSSVRDSIESLIESLVEEESQNLKKLQQNPIEFFKEYVERKRVDTHTGRYIAERTKIHHRTVIHRLESFV